jgi:hypothetical protein
VYPFVVPDAGPSLLRVAGYVGGFLKKFILVPDDAVEVFVLPDLAGPFVVFLHLAGGEGLPGMENGLQFVRAAGE